MAEQKKKIGELVTIYGPMFSGKTTELLRLLDRAVWAKRKPMLFKPAIDNRYGEAEVVTHTGWKNDAVVVEDSQDLLFKALLGQAQEAATDIFIDEGQFFDEGLVAAVRTLTNKGLNVFVAGLNTDFKNDTWPVMASIIALADRVVRLTAVCSVCGADATRTQRLIDGVPAKVTDPVVVLGAVEMYEARCRSCHEVLRDV